MLRVAMFLMLAGSWFAMAPAQAQNASLPSAAPNLPSQGPPTSISLPSQPATAPQTIQPIQPPTPVQPLSNSFGTLTPLGNGDRTVIQPDGRPVGPGQ
jgi:hypothetical protein